MIGQVRINNVDRLKRVVLVHLKVHPDTLLSLQDLLTLVLAVFLLELTAELFHYLVLVSLVL